MLRRVLMVVGLAVAFVAVFVDVVCYVRGPQVVLAVFLLVFIGMLIVAKSLELRRLVSSKSRGCYGSDVDINS